MFENFIEINELKFLLEEKYIIFKDQLFESIKKYGIISPVVVSNNYICDGHKRVAICKKLGISKIPVQVVNGNPFDILFELNDREFSVNEVALLIRNSSDEQINDICSKVGFSTSPQMIFAIKYLGDLLKHNPDLYSVILPANIWRELGHLGNEIEKYATDLLKMNGTVSEKRNIAMFLRQAQRRGELPNSIKAEKAVDIIPLLQKTAQPRRSKAYDKFENALKNISFPGNTNIKIDPTFSQPGVTLTLSVKRSELEELDQIKKSLSQLFNEVPEL